MFSYEIDCFLVDSRDCSLRFTTQIEKMSEKAPPLKKGWMRKQGRSGLVKNWKTRFFVLGEGKIAYYLNESNDAPYGEGLKVSYINCVSSCLPYHLIRES
jgi:hypothetical protein